MTRRPPRGARSWLAIAALAGCSQTPGPGDVSEGDVAFVDDRAARDGTSTDGAGDGGGLDAPLLDGATDGLPSGDTSPLTDAPIDRVPLFDAAGMDTRTAGPCDMTSADAGAGAVCTDDTMCRRDPASGRQIERCLPTGCGTTRRCQLAGRRCLDDADCLAGAQRCTANVCVATSSADCGDTRACALGYACEGAAGARSCVDRRRACTDPSDPCPPNAGCYQQPGVAAFCAPLATRCSSDIACLPGASCRDVDGDGMRECAPDGPCLRTACTTPGQTCEILPVEVITSCGSLGLCTPERPCGAGYVCVDAWGTGVTECHPAAAACTRHSQCAPGQLCTPTSATTAACR